jgi:hypothetical protein
LLSSWERAIILCVLGILKYGSKTIIPCYFLAST